MQGSNRGNCVCVGGEIAILSAQFSVNLKI